MIRQVDCFPGSMRMLMKGSGQTSFGLDQNANFESGRFPLTCTPAFVLWFSTRISLSAGLDPNPSR